MNNRESANDVVLGKVRLRAGFCFTEASELAGGPVELEFFVEIADSGSCYLAVAGDRMRGRPAGFSFDAAFGGSALADPCADLPDMGGPEGLIHVAAGSPLRQPLILNQFVCLEDTLDLLEPGASGQLSIACRRLLSIVPDQHAAVAGRDAHAVDGNLVLELYRDDEELAALVERLLVEVRDGPRERRERPLALLLTLRAPLAVARWRTLVDHADPLVAERARASLLNSGL